MQAADLGPVSDSEKTQSPVDLFLIFAGANIVATTLQTGASLVPAFGLKEALVLVAFGTILGSTLVAALAPLGPRLGVPSVVACRAALGFRGAALVSTILYVTNFAWIAVNNVIAASALARVLGGPASEPFWAFSLGLLATAIVAGGPRAVGHADRVAVPLLLVVGAILTLRCLRLPPGVLSATGDASMTAVRGFDVVVGYQVSWLLMFGDYPRYTRSAQKAVGAVFLGLSLTSLWFMPLGLACARAAGSAEPGAMLQAVGLGGLGALLLVVATLTTNFVNIYMSALAWKSLFPGARDRASIWAIGLVGAALSLLPGWLKGYANFMLLLGGLLVPVGGVLLAYFFVLKRKPHVADLYAPGGPAARRGGFALAGMCGWISGAAAYFLAAPVGGTLPALAAAILVTVLFGRSSRLA